MKKSPSISFTIEQIKRLPCAHLNKYILEKLEISYKNKGSFLKNEKEKGKLPSKNKDRNSGKIISKLYLTKSAEKNFIEEILFNWTQDRGLHLYGEYLFHPERKWRFDWAIPDLKLAVEYNGIISKKSRHTTIGGYSADMVKINEAIKLGWKVLQYTPLNYRNISQDLEALNK